MAQILLFFFFISDSKINNISHFMWAVMQQSGACHPYFFHLWVVAILGATLPPRGEK